jgi:predicted transcriptional regulator
MPSITIRKTVSYTDIDSGASFDIAVSKVKVGKHAYRQTVSIPDSSSRQLLEIGATPLYTKMVYCQVKNVGNFDILLNVKSGGGDAIVTIPPGRTWEAFNTNIWNDYSSTNPDTVDEIIAEANGGDTFAKLDALFA